jgi:hypothetical protein
MRVKQLVEKARVKYKKRELVDRIFYVLYFLMMISFSFLMIILKNLEIISGINKTIFIIIVVFCSMFLPAIILFFPYNHLSKKFPYQSLPNVNRRMIRKCSAPLMKYYKVQDDHIITKCYDSSKSFLIDKDLILFFHKGKLRIVNDFTTTIKDFGCYELSIDEFEVFYEQRDKLLTTIIQSKKLTLLLGKSAKSFIVNNTTKIG